MAKIVNRQNHLERDFKTLRRKRNIGVITILLIFLLLMVLPAITHGTSFSHLVPVIFLVTFFIFTKKGVGINKEMKIIKAGLDGEKETLKVFKKLPDSYTVFSDLEIEAEGKKSQLDHVVVGPNGVFIIETKNLNGKVTGDAADHNLLQSKVGRGGTPYSKQFYNPIKQVSTHVFRLSRYLKANSVDLWVQGAVYFSKPTVQVFINNSSEIPVFCYSDDGRKEMIDYIMNYEGKKEITSVVKAQIEKVLAS